MFINDVNQCLLICFSFDLYLDSLNCSKQPFSLCIVYYFVWIYFVSSNEIKYKHNDINYEYNNIRSNHYDISIIRYRAIDMNTHRISVMTR